MDLTSLYRMVSSEAPSVPEQMMRGAANQAALQQADEQLMANKRLRDLYSSGGQPSMQDLMSIDPRLGIEMQQAQFKNMLEAGQIEKLNREKDESDAKVYAQHIAPIAQDYFDDIKKGMPEQQAEYKFRSAVGQAQSQIEQRFGIKPKVDFSQYPPLQIAQRAHALGVDIPHLKEIEEQQKNQFAMQQKMSPGYADVAGRTEAGPYGTRFVPPAPMPGSRQPRGTGLGGAPAAQMPDGYQKATAEDLPMLEQEYANSTDVNEKQMIGSLINQLKQQTQGPAQGQFVTPEQEAALRMQEEQQKSDIQTKALSERKTTETEIERSQAKQKAIEAFSLVPSLKEVEDLIKGSTSGKKQTQMAQAFEEYTGETTPGMQKIGRLSVIAGRLRDAVNRAPGSQSDKDAIIESLKTGNIENSELGYAKRMEAYREFVRQMREMIKKETGMDAGATESMVTEQTPVSVRSRADVEALPKGTMFVGPDGVLHRRK